MARGRMINQTIAEDMEFNNLSLEAQLVYLRTIPHLDRDGLINGHPTILWGKVAPLLPDLLGAMPAIIDEWIDADLVLKYAQAKTQILYFKGFSKNQIGMRYDREPASTFPVPPGHRRGKDGIEPLGSNPPPPPNKPKDSPPPSADKVPSQENTSDNVVPPTSDNLPANIRQTSGSLPPEENRIEEKRTTTEAAAAPKTELKQNGSGSGGSLPLHRNRQTDENYARICSKFENEGFGTLTEIFGQKISAMLDEYPVDWIEDAMIVAVSANKRQLRYAEGVLVKWRSEGRQDKKAEPTAQAPKILSLREWCKESYGVDIPQFTPVGEAGARERYNQYRNQQTH